MSTYVEYVTYKIDTIDDKFLELRRKAIVAFKAHFPNLLEVPVFSHNAENECTEIWIYQTKADAEKANAEGGDVPEFAEYAALLRNLNIVAETMPTGAEDPIVK